MARPMLSPANARQAHGLAANTTCSGRLAPGGVVRSILRFLFVVVPTAALSTGVVVAVSNDDNRTVTADGDLQRDLSLATTSLELVPLSEVLPTVSAIEAPPSTTPQRTTRPKRSRSGSRAVRSPARAVAAVPEAEVAEANEESDSPTTVELADGSVEGTVEAPAPGGVALPRPTAIPVVFPTGSSDDTYDPGPGTVIRGGSIDPDHCQIGRRGGRVASPPIYRQPRGMGIAERIRTAASGGERTSSIADRIRTAQPSSETRRSSIGSRVRDAGSRSRSSEGSSRGSIATRIRGARGR
jgi:hypothetical protein